MSSNNVSQLLPCTTDLKMSSIVRQISISGMLKGEKNVHLKMVKYSN